MPLAALQFPFYRPPYELGSVFAVLKNGVYAVKRSLREACRDLLVVDLLPTHASKIDDIWYVDKPVIGDIIYASEREIDMHTRDHGIWYETIIAAKARARLNNLGYAFAVQWPDGHCTVEDRKPSLRSAGMRVLDCDCTGAEVLA